MARPKKRTVWTIVTSTLLCSSMLTTGGSWQVTAAASQRPHLRPLHANALGLSERTSVAPYHQVVGFLTTYQNIPIDYSDYQANAALLTQLDVACESVNANASLSGTIPPQISNLADTSRFPVWVTINNDPGTGFSGPLMDQILHSPALTKQLVGNIRSLVDAFRFKGVNIDFENLASSDRSMLPTFLQTLDSQLHQDGASLSIDLPAETATDTSAYDYSAIGRSVDSVVLMAYDYSYPGSAPGPIAPVWWVNDVLSYTCSTISSNKVVLGLPAYGYDWSGSETQAAKLTYIDQQLQNATNIQSKWDATDEAPYYQYTINSVQHTVYYEDTQSLSDKTALAEQYHIRGIAYWRIGTEDNTFWSVIRAYERER